MRKAGNLRWGLRGEADGLTIVELLVALFIVMVAFAALASTVIASFASIRNNEARVQATALASQAVEEMATIRWWHLGLSLDEEEDLETYDADADPDEVTQFEGEVVVLLPDSADLPEHESEVTIGGVEYTITRWITFAEEGDEANLRRMIAIVTWQIGGQERQVRNDGLRAPNPEDLETLVLSLEVEADNLGDPDVTYGTRLDEDDDPSTFKNQGVITATAEIGFVAAGDIRFSFRDRDDNLQTKTATSTPDLDPGDTEERHFTIGSGEHAFKHGATAFTVSATDASGDVASATVSLRFYQDVKIRTDTLTLSQGGQPVEGDIDDPVIVCVSNGAAEDGNEITLEAEVWGMTAGEATPQPDPDNEDQVKGGLTVYWWDQLLDPDREPMVMGRLERTPEGGVFRATLDGEFVWGPEDAPLPNSTTVDADRLTPGEAFDDDDEFTRDIYAEVDLDC